VILWSIGNEIDYPNDPYSNPTDENYDPDRPSADQMLTIAKKLIKAVKETDTTRPVTQALANIDASNDTGLADLLDVVGYNYHEKYYERDHEKYPDRVIMGSENGDYYDAWLAVKNNPFISSQFLWTGVDYLGESGAWPSRTLNFGIVDFTGNAKPVGYWRQSLWAKEPMLHIVSQLQQKEQRRRRGVFGSVSHWTWPGNEGQNTTVMCFSNCDSVELFLNERSLGTKFLKEASHLDYQWNIPYQPGVLKAVGKKDGTVVCTDILRTAGKPAKIVLLPDRKTITAHGQDLSHVMVHVVDKDGTVVPNADNLITFSISGPGTIAGVDNGDIKSTENCKSNKRSAYEGKCLVIVQSQRSPGRITLTATSPSLRPAKINIISKNSK
jgi:beta-galactosidase